MEKPENLVHLAPEQTVAPEGIKRDLQVVFSRDGNRILKVGDPGDVRQWLDAEAGRGREVSEKVVGGAVMPGLTDAHEHPMMFAALFNVVKPGFAYGMDEVSAIKEIQRSSKETPADLPVVVLGFDATITEFTQAKLREIVGNREAAIFDPSFHGCLVTPEMAATIKKLIKDPMTPGGIGSDGHATEEYALTALQVAEAYQNIERIEEAVENKLEQHLFQGITSLHDMVPNTMNELIATLQVRRDWGMKRGMEFPITRYHLRATQMRELESRIGELEGMGLLSESEIPDLFGIKLLADGSLGSYTARMKEPFSGGKGSGIWFHNLEHINDALKTARKYGLKNVAMHAIGDAGIDRALDTALQWQKMGDEGKFDARFRIEHFELPSPQGETLERARQLGVWVCEQPNFLLDYPYVDRLGNRIRLICPHSEILNHAVPMMFGTDGAAGGTDSMLYAMYLATHAAEADQRISFDEAMIASAFTAAQFEHDNRGVIAEGMKADIIVADPALLSKLAPGEPDVNAKTMGETIKSLESKVMRVYKSGQLVRRLVS